MAAPLLYEINTRCWLHSLSPKTEKPATLAEVPEQELLNWRAQGFTHIWLMGVWESGPRARAQALQNAAQRQSYADVLPDWREKDIAGSPYAIGNYCVGADLGGDAELLIFRKRLHKLGLRLILDFVPNHLGLDHPWLREKPQYFVQSPSEAPETVRQKTPGGVVWLAQGKDPNFPAWSDTVQLDYRLEPTRAAMLELLDSVARQCDGVRCDMAMLLLNDIFAKTWQKFPVPVAAPAVEFWSEAISSVKKRHPGFMFLAEAYWGRERQLQELGFDFVYDKEWYDCLLSRQPGELQRQLLNRPPAYLEGTARFLENHDEPRAAKLFSPAEHKAFALLLLGLPGLRLLHEGQLSGAKNRIPVTLIRRPPNDTSPEVVAMYEGLFKALTPSAIGKGEGQLCPPREAWPGNGTSQNCLVIRWQKRPLEFDVVVVNLAPHRSQCYVPLSVSELANYNWSMKNLLGSEEYRRAGEDLQNQGLYLDLPAHAAQLFRFQPVA